MEAYQVILLIVVLASFFYVSVLVYVFGQIREFRRRMKKKVHGLSLLLYERSDALLSMQSVLSSKGVAFSKEDAAIFEQLRKLDFQKPTDELVRQYGECIKTASARIKYAAQACHEIREDLDYARDEGLLKDLERNYRTLIGAYNADVVAYNYWISIPLLRWIGHIRRYRKRTSLS